MIVNEILETLKQVRVNSMSKVPNNADTTTALKTLRTAIEQSQQSPPSPQRVQDLVADLEEDELNKNIQQFNAVRKEIQTLTTEREKIKTESDNTISQPLLVELNKEITTKFIQMIKKETSDPFGLALKIYGVYSFIQIICAEQDYLATEFQTIFVDFASFLQISFSLYKILQPFLAHCVMISKLLNEQKDKLPEQLQLKLTNNETLDVLRKQKPLYTMRVTTQLQQRVQLLYDNKVFETLSYFLEYFLIVPNILIALRNKTRKAINSAAYLPFLYKELPDEITKKIYAAIYHFLPQALYAGEGGKQRRKKTRYYKRKSKYPKRRVTRKINNGPFIQTKELMLSSYLINNNKPIIRGYSIQKKVIPNKKLISINTNIITNNNRPQTKKKT
jgi:hypothetical protein